MSKGCKTVKHSYVGVQKMEGEGALSGYSMVLQNTKIAMHEFLSSSATAEDIPTHIYEYHCWQL